MLISIYISKVVTFLATHKHSISLPHTPRAGMAVESSGLQDACSVFCI